MSTQESDRALVIARLLERSLSRQAAADMLQMAVRRVQRLLRAVRGTGIWRARFEAPR